MLGNQYAVAVGDDIVRLTEHDLHHARVLVEGRRELDRTRRRLDAGESYLAPFRLGDDLLGHDDDVEIGRRDAGVLDRVADEARDIIPFVHEGDARERRQLDRARRHLSPPHGQRRGEVENSKRSGERCARRAGSPKMTHPGLSRSTEQLCPGSDDIISFENR